MTRRTLLTTTLRAGVAMGGTMLAVGHGVAAAQVDPRPPRLDPYIGVVPLVFPLEAGTFQTPIINNWHASRQGDVYPWNHQNGSGLRAHDGIDLYPSVNQPLPVVYAPFTGRVAAVGWRTAEDSSVPPVMKASATTPPPWVYAEAMDTVDNVPLYGNFVWLISTEPASAGYFALYCHLQYEPTLTALIPDMPIDGTTPVGLMGDTGNAAGVPQLHMELHYPVGYSYTCARCAPAKTVTMLDPYASLVNALPA